MNVRPIYWLALGLALILWMACDTAVHGVYRSPYYE